MYSKPHLLYEEQVDLLVSRGLKCPDRTAALGLLRAVGYYRLSAYVYPFRVLLPEDQRCQTSPAQYRSSELIDGVTFGDVASLWMFDRKLRLRVLDGIELVEVGLRTQMAYVAGRRHTFAHVTPAALDQDACDRLIPGNGARQTEFEAWSDRYVKLQSDAKREDYVRHHLVKYGEPLPIWVAVEFLDFGALARLYGLLDRRDQNEIAHELGVSGGPLLAKWLKSLNYVRNKAAHHSRLWNRTLTYGTAGFNPNQTTPILHHIARGGPRDKIYLPLAVTAYLVRHIDPSPRWPGNLRGDVKKFPNVDLLSPETHMGFPANWQSLPLWAP